MMIEPINEFKEDSWREEEFKLIYKELSKDKILTESQKELIHYVLFNGQLFDGHYEDRLIYFDLKSIFNDSEYYDILMSRLILQKKKLELKAKEANTLKLKIQEAFNRLKQERNLFFP